MNNDGDMKTSENPILRLENHLLFGSLPVIERMFEQRTGIIWVAGLHGSGKGWLAAALAWELCRTKRSALWMVDPEKDFSQTLLKSLERLKSISRVSHRSRIRDVLEADTELLITWDLPVRERAREIGEAVRDGLVVLSILESDLRGLEVFEELTSWGIERDKVLSSTMGVISMTLVRSICPECKYRIDSTTLALALSNRYGLDWKRGEPFPFFEGAGCEKCNGTGQHGREAAFEVLYINDELRHLIKQGVIGQRLRDAARRSGWVTMKEYLLGLALEGKVNERSINLLWSSLDAIEKGKQALEEKITELEEANAQLERILVERAKLYEELVEKQRFEQELETAHNVQMGLLPETDPQIPGFDIAGRSIPANHVGGDHYTYIWLDQERTKLVIVIADVAGHEMKAAMTVMRFSEMLRYETRGKPLPTDILAGLNRSLCERLEQRMYVTACIGMLDVSEGSLEVSNAGHPPVYHLSRRTGSVVELVTPRFPLGLSPDVEYEGRQVKLEEGDVLVFYTDGIVEARDREGRVYGFDRLGEVIQDVDREIGAREMVDRILRDVEQFTASSAQEDDRTLVVLKAGKG